MCRAAVIKQIKCFRKIRYELFPCSQAQLDKVLLYLPKRTRVSVTCSPSQGFERTKQMAEELLRRGFDVMPHIAARQLSGGEELHGLADWVRDSGVKEVFVVAGDASSPAFFPDSVDFLREFLELETGIEKVQFAVYPGGHVLVDDTKLIDFALKKQSVLEDYGIHGEAVTQMCFDSDQIVAGCQVLRKAGFLLPLNLGIPGVVRRTKLLSVGMRIGVGESLRFLRKNTGLVLEMLSPSRYDPTDLLHSVCERSEGLGLAGLHCYTFNDTEKAVQWTASHIPRLHDVPE